MTSTSVSLQTGSVKTGIIVLTVRSASSAASGADLSEMTLGGHPGAGRARFP
jgi:hypothetical protein